jgi:hypothetical protein
MRGRGAIGLVALWCALAVGCRATTADAAGVFSAWLRAADERQLAVAEALFADDATIDDGSGSSGPDRVHTWNAMVLDRYRLGLVQLTPISPEHAVAIVTISSLQTARASPIRTYQLDVRVRGGKIRSMAWRVPDSADAFAPAAAPTVGVESAATNPLVGLAVVGAALAGAVAVARARGARARPAPVPVGHRGALLAGLREFVAARRAGES